jgi:hypothetical protein
MTSEDNNSAASEDTPKTWEQENPEIVHEITIEEYQPKGTLTLTLIYFAIVVLMWIFMYFVEFAGNAPSIIE